MANKKEQFNFEESLASLEQLIEQMESGDLSLEQSLQAFEKGIALTRQCQAALREAEQKVQQLTRKDGEFHQAPFDVED